MFAIVYRTNPAVYVKLDPPRKTRPNAAAVAHRAMEFCYNTGTFPKRITRNGPINVVSVNTETGTSEILGSIQVEQV